MERALTGILVVVRPGDQIVVNGRLVGKGWIDVDESLLTGESDLIRKCAGDPVSSGSFFVNGSAVYEALQVGTQSTAYKLTAGARILLLRLWVLRCCGRSYCASSGDSICLSVCSAT
jgi:hypothetical protein